MKRKINNRNRPELSYDPAVPLLGIYLEKTLIQKDTCTPMYNRSDQISCSVMSDSLRPHDRSTPGLPVYGLLLL